MEISRITSVDNENFEEFYSIYSNSFPIYEQRTEQQHLYALSRSNYHVDCYIEDGGILGFIVYWVFEKLVYIEHLAIHPKLRGQNYGSIFLRKFIDNNTKTIVLEIDPIIDEISEKRYLFYKKLGFVKNDFNHFHPAYRKEYPAHRLIVLSTEKSLTEEEYQDFYQHLKSDVMQYSEEDQE